jgi:nicotinate-nucleotide pyrophosphorylase (carboxylating)
MSERTVQPPSLPGGPWLDALLDAALAEDVGGGDVTTDVAIAPDATAAGEIVARREGVLAGLPLLAPLFARLSEDVAVEPVAADGDRLAPGRVAARLHGPAAPILTGERTALNFLQHLSGIATLTARYVAAVAGTGCRILDTRKTLPGYRALDKYAVRCGGGHNHRMGLYDRILLKDNHWAARDAALADLVARGRERHPDLAIELEVDSLDQLAEVLPLRVEWVLLDNFTPETAREAVRLREAVESGDRRTRLEVSGNVDLDSVRAFAEAGVDACSVGRLTHSAPALDLGLDLRPAETAR